MRKFSLLVLFLILSISQANVYPQDDFKSITDDSKKQEGLFNTYEKNEEYYFEFGKGLKDKLFLINMTNLTSIDELGFLAGLPVGQMVVKFNKRGGGFDVVQINQNLVPDTLKYSSYRNEITSRFGPLKTEAVNGDSTGYLVKINSLFTGDLSNLANLFQTILGGYYTINTGLTYIESVKTFPKNIELIVDYVFTSQTTPVPSVPDARSINFKLRYSIIDISDSSSYIPRYYDDRVGYFHTYLINYSNPFQKSEYDKYILRRDLKKKFPYEDISEPVKLIVYWIDRGTPKEYRDAIKKGVLLWNKAFERLGFKNAIKCNVQEDTASWDSEDIRYNVIRWQASSSSGLAGIGPSIYHPFTGEILNSTVIINSEILRFFQEQKLLIDLIKEEENFQLNPFTSNKVTNYLNKQNRDKFHFCNYSNQLRAQTSIAIINYMMENNLTSLEELPKEFLDGYITDLVVHEIGHTLGLRHNFKSSTAYTFAEIEDPVFTDENSISSSVMDYNPPNISPLGSPQGEYWSSTIGNYDMFAIEYGYKIFPGIKKADDETPYLIAVASKSSEPFNVYGSDEDAYDFFGPTSLDPLSQTFDLGNSPLQYGKNKINITLKLFKKIDEYFPQYDKSYIQLTKVFGGLLSDYFLSTYFAVKYIGGAYVTRMKKGDIVSDKYPYIPVSKSEQFDALNFINEYIFNADNYLTFSPSFLKKLQPNTSDFTILMLSLGRTDFPLNDIILAFQSYFLYRFYNPILVNRMLEQENVSNDILTLADLNEYLYFNIWEELKTNAGISKSRRALQKVHLDILIKTLVNPVETTPEESRSLAYKYLNKIDSNISKKIVKDEYGSFHLKECRSRIKKALNSVIISQ